MFKVFSELESIEYEIFHCLELAINNNADLEIKKQWKQIKTNTIYKLLHSKLENVANLSNRQECNNIDDLDKIFKNVFEQKLRANEINKDTIDTLFFKIFIKYTCW